MAFDVGVGKLSQSDLRSKIGALLRRVLAAHDCGLSCKGCVACLEDAKRGELPQRDAPRASVNPSLPNETLDPVRSDPERKSGELIVADESLTVIGHGCMLDECFRDVRH